MIMLGRLPVSEQRDQKGGWFTPPSLVIVDPGASFAFFSRRFQKIRRAEQITSRRLTYRAGKNKMLKSAAEFQQPAGQCPKDLVVRNVFSNDEIL